MSARAADYSSDGHIGQGQVMSVADLEQAVELGHFVRLPFEVMVEHRVAVAVWRAPSSLT